MVWGFDDMVDSHLLLCLEWAVRKLPLEISMEESMIRVLAQLGRTPQNKIAPKASMVDSHLLLCLERVARKRRLGYPWTMTL